MTRGRAGLGSFPTPHVNNSKEKGRCQLVQEEVRAAVEEERACKTVRMRQQGAWSRRENALERRATWPDLWRAEPQFLIQVMCDGLQRPSNLHMWSKVETPACPLCSKHGILEHILSMTRS